MTAKITRATGDQGVVWATGSASAGISVFVQNDRLVVDYNAFMDRTIVESELPVPEGSSTLAVRLRRTSRTAGDLSIAIDGRDCGRAELPFMMRSISLLSDSIGFDHGSPVSERYEGSFDFTGEIHEVVIELGARSAADAETAARTEMARQ